MPDQLKEYQFKPGERPVGRAKGTPNKRTTDVRSILADAAHEIGGRARLVAWIKADPQNEYVFWSSMWMRLAPVRIEGQGPHGEIEFNVKVSHEELPKRLEERGLPLVVFGVDKPVLDLKPVEENKTNGKGSEDG